MKSEKKLVFTVLGLFFLVSGCQEDKGSGDYSGVSDLIADRNKARYEVKERAPKNTLDPKQTTVAKSKPLKAESSTSSADAKEEALSSIILYEEKVKIVGSESDRTLAKGVAYINKKGQIVRIKILKE